MVIKDWNRCAQLHAHTQYTQHFGSSVTAWLWFRICPDVNGLKINRSEAGVRISNKCVSFSTLITMVLAALRNMVWHWQYNSRKCDNMTLWLFSETIWQIGAILPFHLPLLSAILPGWESTSQYLWPLLGNQTKYDAEEYTLIELVKALIIIATGWHFSSMYAHFLVVYI